MKPSDNFLNRNFTERSARHIEIEIEICHGTECKKNTET